jgi:hypothetical protein
MFFDLDTRELLGVRPNPLTAEQIAGLRGSRPAGPPPRPATEPVRVQRRASNTGIVMVVGQKVALGRVHAYRTVTIAVSETTLAIELDDGETRLVTSHLDGPLRFLARRQGSPGTELGVFKRLRKELGEPL